MSRRTTLPTSARGPSRRQLLATLATGATLAACSSGSASSAPAAVDASTLQRDAGEGGRMPVLFLGHGSPMNAIEDNRWSQAFRALGGTLPTPRAVLTVSAHWFVDGTLLTGQARPRTIHDFSGFPPALHEVQYPAPGAPDLARQVGALLAAAEEEDDVGGLDQRWGLDHGTWSVLRHLFPDADVPVIQLSLDRRRGPAWHLDLARALAPLREQGVLIVGSGNIVHNLRDAIGRKRAGTTDTPEWAARFDADVAAALTQRDDAALLARGPDQRGRQAHPSADHWLPLLWAHGAAGPDDRVTFPVEGFDWGSISMRAVRFDAA